MKRTIKFRGKSKSTGKWLFGYFLENEIGDLAIVPPFKLNSYNECSYYEVSYDTIGQYSEMKDANGKDIYENDIVKAPYIDSIFGDIINDSFVNAVIRFIDGSFVVDYGDRRIFLSDLNDNIKVIGNIHDNKELDYER